MPNYTKRTVTMEPSPLFFGVRIMRHSVSVCVFGLLFENVRVLDNSCYIFKGSRKRQRQQQQQPNVAIGSYKTNTRHSRKYIHFHVLYIYAHTHTQTHRTSSHGQTLRTQPGSYGKNIVKDLEQKGNQPLNEIFCCM